MSKNKTLKTMSNTHESEMRGKGQGKDVREPVGKEAASTALSQKEKVRMAMGAQTTIDSTFYENMPEYEGMQLFYENDEKGQVEKWLHLGAILIPRRSKSLQHFKGFTDRAESEWECVPVGKDGSGKTIMCYLLGLPIDEYHALRIAPKEQRNQEILNAMGMGKIREEDNIMSNVTGLKTYAPNNPVGNKRGFEQETTHDI